MLPSTKVLVFDTETTGLPKNRPVEHPEQPWVIQLGAVFFDLASDRFEHTINTLVIPPDNAEIDREKFAGAERVHGISLDMIYANGRSSQSVYRELRDLASEADIIAAYNLDFDEKLIKFSSYRTHPSFILNPVLRTPTEVSHHCIMNQTKDYYKSPKWLKLNDVYQRITGDQIVDAHDALADAVAAAVVFKEITLKMMAEAS
jgi:DNA polymerase III epsilon subunit-like protein